MGTEESQEWDFSGRVQGEGLISRLNTRPLVCRALSARSTDAREARFSASVYNEKSHKKYPDKKCCRLVTSSCIWLITVWFG